MTRTLCLALALVAACAVAHADGGRLRLSKTAGPFLVTLFTTPEPLTPGPADFSLMVQDIATGRVIPDADIRLHLIGPDGMLTDAHAAHGLAPNKLLQSVAANLNQPGTWRLSIVVHDGHYSAALENETMIVVQGSRQATLIWIFLLLPLVAVCLFALHQQQKMKSLRKAQPAD